MTEVNGLRLAYRGFVSGIAGAYVWAAIAMALSGLLRGDPLGALRPMATAITSLAVASPEVAFVVGLAAVQAGGALVGMCFAYFFARFFTVRALLYLTAPAVAIFIWGLLTFWLDATGHAIGAVQEGYTIVATIGYGLVVAGGVPLREQVLRYSGSPST